MLQRFQNSIIDGGPATKFRSNFTRTATHDVADRLCVLLLGICLANNYTVFVRIYRLLCVFLQIKPFFLPVDMQHIQCPCWSFDLLIRSSRHVLVWRVQRMLPGRPSSETSSTPRVRADSLYCIRRVHITATKRKNVSCEIEDIVETYLSKLRGILWSRVLRVLCDLIKNVRPYWGGQNLIAIYTGVRTRTRSGCVVHIEPFFPPVDIQHTQCPCSSFHLLLPSNRDASSVVTKPRHKPVAEILDCNAVSRVDNAMTFHRTGYDSLKVTFGNSC